MKRRCVLFCDCGAVYEKGKWQALDLRLSCFLAVFIFACVDVVELRKMTCPNCLKIAKKVA